MLLALGLPGSVIVCPLRVVQPPGSKSLAKLRYTWDPFRLVDDLGAQGDGRYSKNIGENGNQHFTRQEDLPLFLTFSQNI